MAACGLHMFHALAGAVTSDTVLSTILWAGEHCLPWGFSDEPLPHQITGRVEPRGL